MDWTRKLSWQLPGRNCVLNFLMWSAYSARFSPLMKALSEVAPWVVAFVETAIFPRSVRGPVECWALAWFAVVCAAVDILVCRYSNVKPIISPIRL